LKKREKKVLQKYDFKATNTSVWSYSNSVNKNIACIATSSKKLLSSMLRFYWEC